MDNWFTSSALFSKLSELGFGACGTVRYTTLGIPDVANSKKFPMKSGADPKFFQKAGQLCVMWQDTKRVTLLSNYGDCSVTSKKIRSRKTSTGFRHIKKPCIVEDYNKYMGGTDLAGQLCTYYTHTHKTFKWWKRVFITILDICLLNANVVYNSIDTNKSLSTLDFRVKVIEALISNFENNPVHHARKVSSASNALSTQHFPGPTVDGKKRDCVVCSSTSNRKQTRTICKQCIKPML